MSSASISMDMAREGMNQMFSSLGIGSYTTEKHILVAFCGLFIFTALLILAAKSRGASQAEIGGIMQDIMIGILFALSLIGFLGIFFFWGRAIIRALFPRIA